MVRILITGMSATGKSTVVQTLQSLGYKAIDMDYDDWSEYRSDGEWIWREERVNELLRNDLSKILFIAGCAENQRKFYDRFDKIILLSAPNEILHQRLQTRINNPFGKHPEEVNKILDDLKKIEPMLRKRATFEIQTTIPINEIIQKI